MEIATVCLVFKTASGLRTIQNPKLREWMIATAIRFPNQFLAVFVDIA
jgi:hypothetical protein